MAVLNTLAIVALLTLAACGQPAGDAGSPQPSPEGDPVDDEVTDGTRLPPSPGPQERVDDLELTLEPDDRGVFVTARSTGDRWFAVVTLDSGAHSWEATTDDGENAERLTVLRGAVAADDGTDGDYAFEHAVGVMVGPGTEVRIPGSIAATQDRVQVCLEVDPVVIDDHDDEAGRGVELPLWQEGETVHLACSDVADLGEGR